MAVHFFAGTIVGLILVELYKKYGEDYPYFKAISLGIGMWIIHVTVIPNIINLPARPYLHRTELEAFVDLIAHIVYGIFAGMYLTRMWQVAPKKQLK